MLYIIGLGLNEKGISQEGIKAVKKCKKIYLENYTVEIPYSAKQLEENLGKKIIIVDREFVEKFKVFEEVKKESIALLVYGSPLTATTHISLIQEAKKRKIEYKILYNASILDAIGETGLQLYKFGKIASMPKWDENKNYKPESFIEIIKENKSIKAHSLILIDIDLEFSKALEQLEISAENKKIKLDRIIICSMLGTKNSKIFYDTIENFKDKKINSPFCFIIPSELHFIEREVLENYKF